MYVKDIILSVNIDILSKAIENDRNERYSKSVYPLFLLSAKQTAENIINSAKRNNISNSSFILKIKTDDTFGPFIILSPDSEILKNTVKIKDIMQLEWSDVLSCEVSDNDIDHYGIEKIASYICSRITRLGSTAQEVHNAIVNHLD